MDTLKLDDQLWDLDVDAHGNLATLGDATPQSVLTGAGMRLAQDAATRVRAWRGEVYFDIAQGIRYDVLLGGPPNLAVLQNAYNAEALKVPLCETAISEFSFTADGTRELRGTINLADVAGNNAIVELT